MASSGGHWVKGVFVPADREPTLKAAIGAEIDRIKENSGVERLWVGYKTVGDNPHLYLDELVASVDPEGRGQGRGTAAMEGLTALADRLQVPIHLDPDPRTAGGSNTKAAKRRLVNWYKRFGFRENKGRNYDYRFRGGMLREPR